MMKILVVNDESDAPLLFKQRFHHEIRSGALALAFAHSGEEALEYLQQAHHYSEVVLILSDINIPGMSGLELLLRIKLAQKMDASPLNGVDFGDVQFVDSRIRTNEDISWSVAIEEVLGASGKATVETESSA